MRRPTGARRLVNVTGTVIMALFGKPQITRDGAPVNVIYNKGVALLAYLAIQPRPHGRETLAGLLWGDLPETTAHANLRKVLAALRVVLDDQLEITRQTVRLAPDGQRWVDIEIFQSKLLQLRSTTLEPATLTEGEVGLLEEAASLYTGDFLEGLNIRGAIAFEEWVLPQRERLRQMALHALYTLTAYYTARGLYAQGVESATRLLTLEPWHEEVHRQMMLLLALNGQRSAALDQYEQCRRLLQTELGVEPTPDTVTLYRRISSGELAALPPAPRALVAPAATPARPPHNLPEHLTPFTGRTVELHILRERLTSPQHRLITIPGVSGVGKSRLAAQAASEVMSSFRDGVYFVPVTEIDCAGGLVPAVLAAVDAANHETALLPLNDEPCEDAHLAGLVRFLRGREILLVLDGFERLHDAGPVLCELLRQVPGLKLLLTSLQRLNVSAEAVLPLGGLSWEPEKAENKRDAASGMGSLPPAVQLFDRAAQRTRLDFSMRNGDGEQVARICRLVSGLPLGIEIAAGWVGILPCSEIANEIERSLDFLAAPLRDRPPHHASLRAALNQSWRHLASEEQAALMRLSVLPAGFTREVAADVAGASLQTLMALAGRGLLRSTPFGRYELHRFVAQYAVELLAELPEEYAETVRRSREYQAGSASAVSADQDLPTRFL
jgi:DNA-binding SARP family transcriptional activator/predicted ATPase